MPCGAWVVQDGIGWLLMDDEDLMDEAAAWRWIAIVFISLCGLCVAGVLLFGCCSAPATVPSFASDEMGYKYRVVTDSPPVCPVKEVCEDGRCQSRPHR